MILASSFMTLKKKYDLLWQDFLDLQREIEELESELEGYLEGNKVIYNIDDFKYRLRLDGLLSNELELFIDQYIKYYNSSNKF